jgi:hypothetical protein
MAKFLERIYHHAIHRLRHDFVLRRVGTDDETLAELAVLAGYDDLAAQSPRLRDALTHIHPALERLFGPRRCARSARRSADPAGAAQPRPGWPHRNHATAVPAAGQDLPTQILTALDTQTVVVPGPLPTLSCLGYSRTVEARPEFGSARSTSARSS